MTRFLVLAVALIFTATPVLDRTSAAQPAWVARSNQHAKILLDVMAALAPEGAGRVGVEGLDAAITDISPGFEDRTVAAVRKAVTALEAALATEIDPRVKQDLQIMIGSATDTITGVELNRKFQIPYFNVAGAVFGGLRALLDEQVLPVRRSAALVRLRKYAGVEPDFVPWTTLAEQATRARMNVPGLLWPSKAQVERGLADSAAFVDGIPQLFDKFKVAGYEEAFAKLKSQIAAYDEFARKEILPKARTDFRQPAELYAFQLRQYGVDIPPAELARMAHTALERANDVAIVGRVPPFFFGEGRRHRLHLTLDAVEPTSKAGDSTPSTSCSRTCPPRDD